MFWLQMSNRRVIPESGQLCSAEFGSVRRYVKPSLLAACFALLSSLSFGSSLEAQPTPPPYLIELGHATVLPGSSEVSVPVFITNAEPLVGWQMGLDYDDLLLGLIGVTTLETLSEPLSPQIFLTGNSTAYASVSVIYSALTPLLPGTDQLVLWLTFAIQDPTLIPAGTSITEIISIVADPIPISFDLTNGTSVVPAVSNGTIALYAPPLIRVGRKVGTLFDQHILVPIELWSAGPATIFEMGLDYDDLLLGSITLVGGEFESLGNQVVATMAPHPLGHMTVVIEVLGGLSLPTLTGGLVGYLDFTVSGGPIHYSQLFTGAFSIDLVPGSCWIDSTEILNTLDGELVIEDQFIRGDVNFTGDTDIADVQALLNSIFVAGKELPCKEAGDVNDSGEVDVSDAISLAGYLFSGGTSPPPPFPTPGVDPDPSAGPGCF